MRQHLWVTCVFATTVASVLSGCSGPTKSNADGGHPDSGHVTDAGPTNSTPSPTSITPSSGPVDGGTSVEIDGTGFQAGASVRIGGFSATSVQVASATKITAKTPAGAAGPADVVVLNPDERFGTLAHGFTYVGSQQSGSVDWCNLQFPVTTTGAPNAPLTLYGRVYKAGVTDQVGQGAGIHMQAALGYADGGFNWVDATYNTDADGSSPGDHANDEYQWVTTYPNDVGNYPSAFRAQYNGGTWTYCEADGPHAALDPTNTGTVTVQNPQPSTVDWCNLQFPITTTGAPNAPLTLYGRVYKAGLTDSVGQGAGITVQAAIGYEDGGYNWQNATYNTDTDNNANDEYLWNTNYPVDIGNYPSAFRAQINGGAWTYCEKDGPHPAFDPTNTGTVTVVPPAPDQVDWCNLQFPQSATLNLGDAFTLYGRVYKAGVTDQVGQGAGIHMQAALGYADGGFNWVDATYNTDVDGNSPGDHANDEYQWASTASDLGTFATAYRAQLDGGPWSYCETDGIHAALDPAHTGSITVVPVPPSVVSWCNLQFPLSASGGPGDPFTFFGQVFQAGITDSPGQGAGIFMQAGLTDSSGNWNWSDAVYDADRGNNDEYELVTADPTTPGNYSYAFRAALDGGPWTYCELNGPNSSLQASQAGTLTVQTAPPPEVGWCNLQSPLNATSSPGGALRLYGQVWLTGVTDQAGQGAGISMQAGISIPDDGGWTWTNAVYDSDQSHNDQYHADTTAPSTQGSYYTTFRAQFDGGPWVYCEPDGLNATFDPTDAGTLTVQANTVGAVGWCNLQFPAQATAHPGDTVNLYGRVYEQGVTDQVGQGPGIFMEAGFSLVDGGFGWTSAQFNVDADGPTPGDHSNDEYALAATAPAVGNYTYAFRATLDGGPWTYCELDGPHASIDATQLGVLSVSAPPPPPMVSWCNLQYPTSWTCSSGAAVTFYGQVYQPGITDASGQGTGITMQAGVSQADGGWSWNATVYNVDFGNNDEYKWDTTCPAVGAYSTAFRAQLDGGPWSYCEVDGIHATFDPTQTGSLTVQ
jgi:hypothetical protein